jgi:putative hydrolase
MAMLGAPGPLNWEVAEQVARTLAAQGGSEAPVDHDPPDLTALAEAAQTHVAELTGLPATLVTRPHLLLRDDWVSAHLTGLRVVLDTLAGSLGGSLAAQLNEAAGAPEVAGDPMAGMLPILTPILLGIQAGSMIGFLARHALGRYDLPLPTDGPPALGFVVNHIDAFEREWGLPRADLRFYLAIHEVVHVAVRSVAWVRERLLALSCEYAGAYQLDTDAIEAAVSDLDPTNPESLQALAARPEQLLGAMRSPRQLEILARLRVFTAVLEGYADTALETIGRPLIPSYDRIHEAIQRHRLERGEAGRFIEGLLGLSLERSDYDAGQSFCHGVVERAGFDGLNRLWTDATMEPTPAELGAPGLWLARIELP